MDYTITSDRFEVGKKKKGDQIAEKELLEAGLNIDALLGAGHLSSNTASKTNKEGVTN